MFYVVNRKTLDRSAPYKTKQAARKAVDRLDNAYGAYVHTIKEEVPGPYIDGVWTTMLVNA